MASANTDAPSDLTPTAICPVRSVPVVAISLAHRYLIQDETPSSLRIEQSDGVLHRLPWRVPRSHHQYDLTGNFCQRLPFVGNQQGRRIQQQYATGCAGAQAADDLPHAVAAQKFRGAIGPPAGG